MGLDYYNVLKVNRNANDDELKQAYHKLTMKWHPDKNLNNKNEAEAKFKKIIEAYRLLSAPQKRALYYQFGEERLKGQVPSSGSGGFSGSSTFRFNSKAFELFSQVFGHPPSFRSMGQIGESSSVGPFSQSKGAGASSQGSSSMPSRKAAAIEHKLQFSLEDLYHGTTKKT